MYTYVKNNPLRYTDPTGHAAQNARYSQNQVDYLNGLVASGGGSAAWAKQQLIQGRYYVDPNESGVAYTVGEMDTGTPRIGTPGYDWNGEIAFTGGATAAIATYIYSCAAFIAAGDVATMGTTITSGTVIAGKALGLGARTWNWAKSLVGKGDETVSLYRTMSEADWGKLDGIGAARYIDNDILNANYIYIKVVK